MTAPSFTYEAVAEDPERVREELCRLWGYNLGPDESAEAKFRWLYRDAPDPAKSVFVVKAKDASGGEKIVGTNGVAVRRFQVSGRDALVGISADLAVDREHRGLVPALRLLAAVKALIAKDFACAYGLPNKKAEPVMVRAGFKVLGQTTRYARVLKHSHYAARFAEREGLPPIVARAAKNPILGQVAGAVLDVARLGYDAPEVARAAKTYRLVWTDRFDDRFDALWAAARGDYDVVGARTSAFLRWRNPSPQVATLVRRSDDSLRAYAVVLREDTGAAELRDVFGHADALEPLIDLLLPSLWLRGHPSVSVRFVGAPRVAALLKARGFESRPQGARNVYFLPGNSEEGERLLNPDRWHLFNVDEDA